MNPTEWNGRRVLVTGHTGFKGAWLSLWLDHMGAQVTGVALNPDPRGIFEAAQVGGRVNDLRFDIRNDSALQDALCSNKPEIVFHLAAQSMVPDGYENPRKTFQTNVMGTLNVLESVRDTPSVRACVVITTDKVYEHLGKGTPFDEDDQLGGHDPYSASKACAEILASSYRRSFFVGRRPRCFLATARAGNVIGGGDVASRRLVPNILQAWDKEEPVVLRNPNATRPWQHVLEPLAGYMELGEHLLAGDGSAEGAWNFGPASSNMRPVCEVVDAMATQWPDAPGWTTEPSEWHETETLRLDSTRARQSLGWSGRWDLDYTLSTIIEWHLADANAKGDVAIQQINTYQKEVTKDETTA